MNEAQDRHDLIDPALRAAGWEALPAKVAVEQTIAPKFLVQTGVDKYLAELAKNVFCTDIHVVFQAVKLREEQIAEIRRRRMEADEAEVAEMVKEQKVQLAAQEQKAKEKAAKKAAKNKEK